VDSSGFDAGEHQATEPLLTDKDSGLVEEDDALSHTSFLDSTGEGEATVTAKEGLSAFGRLVAYVTQSSASLYQNVIARWVLVCLVVVCWMCKVGSVVSEVECDCVAGWVEGWCSLHVACFPLRCGLPGLDVFVPSFKCVHAALVGLDLFCDQACHLPLHSGVHSLLHLGQRPVLGDSRSGSKPE
jgi:hypothetical protein